MIIAIDTYQTLDLEKGEKVSNYEIEKIDGDVVYTVEEDKKGLALLQSKTNHSIDIVKPIYEYIGDFHSGIAIVGKDDFYTIINKQGKEILNEPYEDINYLGSNLYKVKKGNYLGVIDEKGNIIIDINSKSIDYYKFKEKEILVADKLKFSLRQKISYTFTSEYDPYVVLFGVTDKNGKAIIPFEYQTIIPISDQKLFACSKSGIWHIIDYQNNILKTLSKKYHHLEIVGNVACTYRKNYRGLIDLEGNEIIEVNNAKIRHSNGLIRLDKTSYTKKKWNHNYFVFDYEGNQICKADYKDDCWFEYVPINKRAFWFSKRSDYKDYMFYHGQFHSSQYSDAYVVDDGNYILVSEKMKSGVLDKNLSVIVEPQYDYIGCFNNGIFYFEVDERCGFINHNNIILKEFDKLSQNRKVKRDVEARVINGLLYYRFDNNWGIMSLDGQDILKPIKASRCQYLNEELILVDNYIFNINHLNISYNLDFYIDNEEIKHTFKNLEDRNQIINEINNLIKTPHKEAKTFKKVMKK